MKTAKTKQTFIDEAKQIHGDKFDYSLVKYKGTHVKVKIVCPIHGVFEQSPNTHLSKKCGCNGCRPQLMVKKSQEKFITQALKIHGCKYDYSLVHYVSTYVKVNIVCPTHGVFAQTPDAHIKKAFGCQKCGREAAASKLRVTQEQFIERAKIAHGDKYSYASITFIDMATKVIIGCPIHGEFAQKASNHVLLVQGCPRCHSFNSRLERLWLDDIGVPNDTDHRQVTLMVGTKKYKVDGYDRSNNTIYEFMGDYWHGNPETYNPDDVNEIVGKTYSQLYNDTIKKITHLQQSGYTVVVMWENEYRKNKIISLSI